MFSVISSIELEQQSKPPVSLGPTVVVVVVVVWNYARDQPFWEIKGSLCRVCILEHFQNVFC